jgi:hypothetical protein
VSAFAGFGVAKLSLVAKVVRFIDDYRIGYRRDAPESIRKVAFALQVGMRENREVAEKS